MELLVFVHRFRISILAETRMNGNQLTEYMEIWETKKIIGAMDPVISSSIALMEILKNKLLNFSILHKFDLVQDIKINLTKIN